VVTRRWLVLTDGYLHERNAKTAHGVIRYSDDDVVAVLDPNLAGRDLRDEAPSLARAAPIVDSVEAALRYEPTSLLLGVATPGGWMPEHWREWLFEAVDAGLEIANGLHTLLREDVELVDRAARTGARLWDVRVPPGDIPLFSGRTL
jgi:uncharacterized NAD-dependent epimerase/dehydratase family protein